MPAEGARSEQRCQDCGKEMYWLASMLANRVRGVVRHRTGLAGRYALDLTWTTSSSFVESVQEQLGLRLVRITEPVDVLVIDSVAFPNHPAVTDGRCRQRYGPAPGAVVPCGHPLMQAQESLEFLAFLKFLTF